MMPLITDFTQWKWDQFLKIKPLFCKHTGHIFSDTVDPEGRKEVRPYLQLCLPAVGSITTEPANDTLTKQQVVYIEREREFA